MRVHVLLSSSLWHWAPCLVGLAGPTWRGAGGTTPPSHSRSRCLGIVVIRVFFIYILNSRLFSAVLALLWKYVFLQRVMRPVTHAGHLLALRVPCSRVSACFRAELTSQDRKQGFCALMTMVTVPTLCPGPGSSHRWEVLQRSRVTGGARTQPPAVFNTFREHRLGQGETSPPRPGGLRAGAEGRTAAWFSLPCPSGRFHLGLAEILFVRPPLQSFRKPLPILASRC